MDDLGQEKIESFMGITCSDEAVAIEKLIEHNGNLNEAVNAYMTERDNHVPSEINAPNSFSEDMELDVPPFNPLDIFPPISFHQPRSSREIPIEVKDENTPVGPSRTAPIIEEVTDLDAEFHPRSEPRQNAIIEELDDDVDVISMDNNNNNHIINDGDDLAILDLPVPSAPLANDYNNDIEEQMILAAIEASRREAEDTFNTAEQERALRERNLVTASSANNIARDQSDEEEEEENDDVEEDEPLVRHRYPTRGSASRSAQHVNYDEPEEDEIEDDNLPVPLPAQNGSVNHINNNSNVPSDEWGGLSNMEHDEAVMLEAAMFGGIPEGNHYRFGYPHIINESNNNESLYPRAPIRAPSPGLTEQRLLREQQDDEYLAALQADQEKEIRANQEREAEIERKRLEEEETMRKQLEEEEFERKIRDKEASLPEEPLQEDENAITLLVRMPDGARRSRRFLKSHKLQALFDFIDIARVVKPNSYRLVRPYPRKAFTDGESEMTLNDLGLSSKQEALFLESI